MNLTILDIFPWVLAEADAGAVETVDWLMRIIHIGIYVVVGVVLNVIARFISRGIVRRVEDDDHATLSEREKRARTLASVFNNFVLVVVSVIVIFLILQEFGVNITPLLAGAGLVGFVIAFSAQSFVKDVLNGFFILMENQFQQGDIVKIGAVSGVVERITLRSTRIRALDGGLHFIPNSSISQVSNLTHGWSGVMFDVAATCEEDSGKVRKALKAVLREVATEERYKDDFLDEPQVFGPLELGGANVTYRVLAKTKPFKSEALACELRQRIKPALEKEGIRVIKTS